MNSIIKKLLDIKKSEYSHTVQILKNSLNYYEHFLKKNQNQNKEFILSKFRKHCINTGNYAKHNCGSKYANFILAKDRNNNIKFVICESCKKVYYSSYILCKCDYCNADYYSNIINEEDGSYFLFATWEKYHCPQIFSEKMKCIKCQEFLYINMKNGMLICLNKKCNFISNPKRITWICSICQKDFKSNAIPYNPLENKAVENEIKRAILLKHKAHPNSIPCCQLNAFFVDFFHNKKCKGNLYEGQLNDKKIIVCDKCYDINFYERFTWTCPKCLRKFKENIINFDNDEKANNKIKNIDKKGNIQKRNKYNSVVKDNDINNSNLKKNINKNEKNEIININNIKKDKLNDIESSIEIDLPSKRNEKIKLKRSSSQIITSNFNQNNSRYFNISMNEQKGNQINNLIINNNNISIYYSKYNNENKNKQDKVLRQLKSEQLITKFLNRNVAELNKKEEKNNKNHHKLYVSIDKKRSSSVCQNPEKEAKYQNNYFKNSNEEFYRREVNNNRDLNKNKNLINKRNYSIEYIYHVNNDASKPEPKNKFKMIKVEYNPPPRKNRFSSVDDSNRNIESKIGQSNEINYNPNNYNIYNKMNKKYIISENCNNIKNKLRFRANHNNKNDEINQKINIKIEKNNGVSDSNIDKSDKEKKNKENHAFCEIKQEPKNIKNNKGLIIKGYRNKENNINNIMRINNQNINQKEPSKNCINYNIKNKNNISKDNAKENFSAIPDNIGLENLIGITEQYQRYLKLRINKIFSELKIPLFNIEDYTINSKLGEGSFGIIYSIFKKSEIKKEYALKKIIAKSITEVTTFIKEFELVYISKHPNIMEIYGFCLRIFDSTTYIIYVLMEKSKYDWDKEIRLNISKRNFYSEQNLINILKQLCEALIFLKNNNISHRDIKPQNVLIFKNNTYKLADFGEAKEIKISKKLNTLRGTELYMSPKLYEGLKNNKNDINHDSYKSDVFSLGFCFLYAASLEVNLLYQVRDITDNNILNDIINTHLNKYYSEKFIKIIGFMLKIDEIKRFGFNEIIEYIESNYS